MQKNCTHFLNFNSSKIAQNQPKTTQLTKPYLIRSRHFYTPTKIYLFSKTYKFFFQTSQKTLSLHSKFNLSQTQFSPAFQTFPLHQNLRGKVKPTFSPHATSTDCEVSKNTAWSTQFACFAIILQNHALHERTRRHFGSASLVPRLIPFAPLGVFSRVKCSVVRPRALED